MSKKSAIWTYFSQCGENEKRHACNICGHRLTASTSIGTSSLHNHMRTRHPNELLQKPDVKKKAAHNEGALPALLNKSKLWDVNDRRFILATKAVGIGMCQDLQPYSWVEDKGIYYLAKY